MKEYCCPVCKKKMTLHDKSMKCPAGHTFDFAKQGYINLLRSNQTKSHGDNPEMVHARTAFLNQGYYAPLKERIIALARTLPHNTILDCGCGEGYYTSSIQNELQPEAFFAVDVSKEALKYAARQNKHIHYAVASVFDVPLEDSSIDLIFTLFAPAPLKEYLWLLQKEGHVIFVSPGPDHLYELKRAIYDTPYLNEPLSLADASLNCVSTESLKYSFTLKNNEEIWQLFAMTPYYFKTSLEDKEKLKSIEQLTVTAEFLIQVYKKSA